MNVFGERLNELRKDRGITQDELALKLHVSKSAVSGWEVGRREANTETMLKIADILNTTVSYLIGETNRPEKINYDLINKNIFGENTEAFFRYDTSKLNDDEKTQFNEQLEEMAEFIENKIIQRRNRK